MASSSPSEFLTFLRTVKAAQGLRARAIAIPFAARRPFSTSIQTQIDSTNGPKQDGPDRGGPNQNKKHVLEKDENTNVQTSNSKAGRQDRANDAGGVATEQKNHGAREKAKEEFPEAPVTIGFEDERGGKGH